MKIIIIGNGVAGTTCAMTLRQDDRSAQITLISKESPYFYSRTALMYAFMARMQLRDLEPFERDVYGSKRIDRIHDAVIQIDYDNRTVVLASGLNLSYDKLVLATGAIPNFVPWKGLEDLAHKHDGSSLAQSGLVHLVSLQDLAACESLVNSTEQAVVVGGGLIGIELVECLAHHGIKVVFLIREDSFWPAALDKRESDLVVAHLKAHGIEVRLNEVIDHVERDSTGRVRSVVTSTGESLPCQLLGVCVGVKPSVSFLKNVGGSLHINVGIVTDRFLRTSVNDVFACGDCAEIDLSATNPQELNGASSGSGSRVNELNWYAAKRQGELVAQNVLGRMKPYTPPLFFNSSKFFEIEFTNVGYPQVDAKEHPAQIWVARGGQAILRVVHEAQEPHRVLSFNVLGARVDHALLASWVEQKKGLAEVISRFQEAQFDVEFGRVPFEKSPPLMERAVRSLPGGAL